MIVFSHSSPDGRREEFPCGDVETAVALKISLLSRDATLAIHRAWNPLKQSNAALTLGAGADTELMTLADARLCLTDVEAGVMRQRSLEAQVVSLVESALTDEEISSALTAITW